MKGLPDLTGWRLRLAILVSQRHLAMRSSHVVLDQIDEALDDKRMVANAGLLLRTT